MVNIYYDNEKKFSFYLYLNIRYNFTQRATDEHNKSYLKQANISFVETWWKYFPEEKDIPANILSFVDRGFIHNFPFLENLIFDLPIQLIIHFNSYFFIDQPTDVLMTIYRLTIKFQTFRKQR
jgi:hypothetical protein